MNDENDMNIERAIRSLILRLHDEGHGLCAESIARDLNGNIGTKLAVETVERVIAEANPQRRTIKSWDLDVSRLEGWELSL